MHQMPLALAILDKLPPEIVFLVFLGLGAGIGALLRAFRTPEKGSGESSG